MGYLIQPEYISKTVIIPEADVLTLGTTPFLLLNYSGTGYIQCINIAVTAASNQTTGYNGYDYIYLSDPAPSNSILAVFEEGSGIPIENVYLSNLCINLSHPPTRFGTQNKIGQGFALKFDNNVTVGDGDLIVFFQYRILYGI